MPMQRNKQNVDIQRNLVRKISAHINPTRFAILLTCIFQNENLHKFQESVIGHPESNYNHFNAIY